MYRALKNDSKGVVENVESQSVIFVYFATQNHSVMITNPRHLEEDTY